MSQNKNPVRVRKASTSEAAAPVVATIAPKATSDKQRAWLLKNGIEADKIPALSRDSMKLMDKIIGERRQRGFEPATEAQLRFLEEAGYHRDAMKLRTKAFCSNLIYQIKSSRGA